MFNCFVLFSLVIFISHLTNIYLHFERIETMIELKIILLFCSFFRHWLFFSLSQLPQWRLRRDPVRMIRASERPVRSATVANCICASII